PTQNQLVLSRLVSESALTNEVNHNIPEDMEDIKTSKLTSNITINQKNSVVEKQAEFEIDTKVFKEVSLDQSIWASKKESCTNKRNIKTKVAAINMLSNNMKQREKSIRWSLRENTHIKKISEKFKKGNLYAQSLSTVRK
ncbi:11597_t:CDS:1, partial [Cetraspora pellucida]